MDIETEDTAWEVEWPYKWPQAIGQALFYRVSTGKKGGVILLMGRGKLKAEIVYYLRSLATATHCDLQMRVERVDL